MEKLSNHSPARKKNWFILRYHVMDIINFKIQPFEELFVCSRSTDWNWILKMKILIYLEEEIQQGRPNVEIVIVGRNFSVNLSFNDWKKSQLSACQLEIAWWWRQSYGTLRSLWDLLYEVYKPRSSRTETCGRTGIHLPWGTLYSPFFVVSYLKQTEHSFLMTNFSFLKKEMRVFVPYFFLP